MEIDREYVIVFKSELFLMLCVIILREWFILRDYNFLFILKFFERGL